MINNTHNRYGWLTKLFHWLVFFMVAAQLFVGYLRHEFFSHPESHQLMLLHKSLGLTLIPVMLLFILWSCFQKKPAWPAAMPRYERIMARVAHVLIYALILVMSISGWCWSSSAGYPPSWFGLCTLPAPWVAGHTHLTALFSQIHVTCAVIVSIVLGVHILAAFKHYFFDRDDILQRML